MSVFDFSRWRPPPSWILNFQNFNGRNGQEGQNASWCQILSKSLEQRPRYDDFSTFPRWRPSAILDLWCVCWDHLRGAFGGLYHCAKFGWNRCSSFDNMHIFRFREFGLKTHIHAPKLDFEGVLFLTPWMGSYVKSNPKMHTLARVRVVWAVAWAIICENPSTGLTYRYLKKV